MIDAHKGLTLFIGIKKCYIAKIYNMLNDWQNLNIWHPNKGFPRGIYNLLHSFFMLYNLLYACDQNLLYNLVYSIWCYNGVKFSI